MAFTESVVEQATLASPTPGTTGIAPGIPTRCRDTTRRPTCRAESRQESRRHGGSGGLVLEIAPFEPGAERADDARVGLEVRVETLP